MRRAFWSFLRTSSHTNLLGLMNYLLESSRSVPGSWLQSWHPSSSNRPTKGRCQITGHSSKLIPFTKKAPAANLVTTDPLNSSASSEKTLEHMDSNLHKHLNRHEWLAHNQHGFCQKYSCESQLLITTTDLYRTMESGGITDAIVLNFSKAFDKVPHRFLLWKLSHIKVHGNQCSSFSSSTTSQQSSALTCSSVFSPTRLYPPLPSHWHSRGQEATGGI